MQLNFKRVACLGLTVYIGSLLFLMFYVSHYGGDDVTCCQTQLHWMPALAKLQRDSVLINDTSRKLEHPHLPLWQQELAYRVLRNKTKTQDPRFYLSTVIRVRIYEKDPANWTVKELKQWLHFQFLSGVDHVYLCDNYKYANESLRTHLRRYISVGLVSYFHWSYHDEHSYTVQVKCYQHMLDYHGEHSVWHMAIDMDEYAYSPADTKPGFLARYLRKQTQGTPIGKTISQITMDNFLMLGQGDRSRNITVDRIDRIAPKPASHLVKPIYRPTRVRAHMHNNIVVKGKNLPARHEDLMMLHYWGSRLQGFGPDAGDINRRTLPMYDMRELWGPRIARSLLQFGEDDAFSTNTGP